MGNNPLLDQLINALNQEELGLTGEEIADIFWLTLQRIESLELTPNKQQFSPPTQLEPQIPTGLPTPNIPPNFPEIPSASANIYSNSSTKTQTSTNTQALTLGIPDAPSLREPIKLAQSLRPLMRRVASGREMILDEIATVERTAAEGICIPVFQPEPEPWLDLALVVDESRSMLIWRHTIRELRRLLEHYGIFRDVRTWGLVVVDNNSDQQNKEIRLRPEIGQTANHQRLARPEELTDPTGRRLTDSAKFPIRLHGGDE
ncbi:hypothetical protein WA1_16810 [Scytonema hofmannii PCC 7110]|uniref:Uncharacterized protein n=1 Tax=Scytonema hofmannii PCC 7110 TaxID=128403 RepID=A0A139XAG3_9CYAN|nr:hypothetical protein [Scytonema hofmannii]KYC41698.1 hypothetical protein WA1_16810 [Scytonema hofmannii PCC 7110]